MVVKVVHQNRTIKTKMKSSLLSQEQKAGKSDEHFEEEKASGTEKAKYIRWN